MSTAEVLDRTFSLYRKHFLLFAGISALPPAVILVLQVILLALGWKQSPDPNQQLSGAAVVGMMFGVLLTVGIWLVGFAFSQAATVSAVSAVHLDRPITIRESFQRVRGRYGKVVLVVILTLLLLWITLVAVMFATAILITMTTLIHPIVGGVVGVAVGGTAFCFALYFVLRFALAIQACTLEGVSSTDSMTRSWRLTKGNVGRVFVVYFLLLIVTYGVALGLTLPAMALGGLLDGARVGFWTQLLEQVASFLASSITGPIAAIALSLIYYDERVRKEAFDLQLMMGTVDGTPAPQPLAAGGTGAVNTLG